jgi:hypothetical protein
MKRSDENLSDDQLAEFADQVLAGKTLQPDPGADKELRALEATILRLNRAITHTELDKAALRRLESRLALRLRQEQEQRQTSFWHRWINGNWRYGTFRLPLAVTIGLLAVTTVAALIALMFPMKGASVTATALATTQTLLTVIMLAGVMLILILINRRK